MNVSRTVAFDEVISGADDVWVSVRLGVRGPHRTTIAPVDDCQPPLGESARASLGKDACLRITVGLWWRSEAAQ